MDPQDDAEGVWRIRAGQTSPRSEAGPYKGEVVDLDHSNPFGLEIERVWFDGRVVFAAEQGELDVDADRVKVAQEYQVVYEVELGPDAKPVRPPERVIGQFNIYDSVPGMPNYSPIWQFHYVVVPRDYAPNTLRSEADCLASGFPIHRSRVFEN